MQGKTHSSKTRKKLSEQRIGIPLSEHTKQKLSTRNQGSGNPFFGKKHTDESINKMSMIQKVIARRGKDCNFYGKQYHGKGQWYIRNSSRIWMRSSWEIKLATYLDAHNINWEYEPKRFPITYIYNTEEKNGTYAPDFYITKEKYYIEVKGYWRDDAQAKYEAFIEQYPQLSIRLYEKKELLEYGIL